MTSNELEIKLPNGYSYTLLQTSIQPRTPNIDKDESLVYQLLNRDLRNSLIKSSFELRGKSAFEASAELQFDVNTNNEFIQKVVEHVKIHPGFYYRLRIINSKLFIQITPKSVLEFNVDLHTLMQNRIFSERSLEYLCQRVRLHNNRTASLRTILEKTCNTPLSESPYNSLTYFDYITKTSDSILTHKDAHLLLVQEKWKNRTSYSSSEGARPIIDFTSLAQLDPDIHARINEKLKRQSAQRRDLAIKYANMIHLTFNEKEAKIGARVSYSGNYSTPIELWKPFPLDKFLYFRAPIVSFRDSNGNIKNASKETGDRAAPQDLLTNKGYHPFLVPREIKLAIMAVEGLENEAKRLKDAFLNAGAVKTLDLQKILHCTFLIGEIQTIRKSDGVWNIPSVNADCALVVGKKDETGEFGIKSNAYVDTEVSLLERGIPVQYIVHDPGKQYGLTVDSKITNQYSFLGLALSILTKIGGSSMVISKFATNAFLENSVILGYNVARVFKPLDDKLRKMDTVLDFTKTSIPLSASVSIMDQVGAEIIHQAPHAIQNENSLFKGESGHRIFDNIPDIYPNIIIHKDGFFQKSELDDLAKLKRKRVGLYPISIVTNEVPRISATEYKYLPKDGACLPLSENEFLLSTTLTQETYDPVKKGWPNPILITIHKLPEQTLAPQMKLRILSQIWALTRSHPASMNPTRRPMSLHYSNKIGQFIRKARDPEPSYFKQITGKRNRLGLYPKPFI